MVPLSSRQRAAERHDGPHKRLCRLQVRCPMTLLRLVVLLLPVAARTNSCANATCEREVQTLLARLQDTAEAMSEKGTTLRKLEGLRTAIAAGQRVELSAAERKHLERGNLLVPAISHNAQHKPLSTNLSRLQHLETLAEGVDVQLHGFMPLKRVSQQRSGPGVLMVAVNDHALWLFTLEGEALLQDFDLGHSSRVITHLSLSPSQDNHIVLTADDRGEMRVHNVKIVAKREKDDKDERQERERQLNVTAVMNCSFSVPEADDTLVVTSLLVVERGSQTFFVAGDSLGGISVFYRDGSLKGRVIVTEDHGGVVGLQRGQSQTVLFYSTHSFGTFSTSQLDVQAPVCNGWESPLFDIVQDPSGRVVLALSDGDVLVFSTTRGKSKAFDLTLKFPHVSLIPLKLLVFKGHVMGLPIPPSDSAAGEFGGELLFFNLAAMEAGYGSSASSALALQLTLPDRPVAMALHAKPGTNPGDRTKAVLSLHMHGKRGLELYDLTLRQPPAPKQTTPPPPESSSTSSWLNWFPKIAVFGVALAGVVVWNVRKGFNQKKYDAFDDYDDDYFREREKDDKDKEKDQGGRSTGGIGSLEDDDQPIVEEVHDE